MIVVDTNVLSELMRLTPSVQVSAWFGRQTRQALTITSVTVAEVRYGVARLPPGRRRQLLTASANDIFGRYADRILSFDHAAADHYADIVVGRERAGLPISAFDAQIAAICRARGAVLATRDAAGFVGLGLEVTDPWLDE